MIGRTTRKCVVYVDGIPIESTLLDAGESGLKGIQKYNPSSVSTQDPRALFEKYDADSSGDIDYDEFKVLLKDLSINLSEPKARAYFKRCDRRRRGCISFDEFRLALYTCDPKHPNRTGGFAPGQSMAPKDLFEMFDRDEEGTIDRDVFGELLDFIGRKMPLDKMEEVFAAYEDPELEAMPYMQFKKAWLAIVDVQAELRLRGERFNKFLPPAMLAKRLAMLVSLEEKQEARTLLEADNALSDEAIILQRRELVKEAQFLARVTLTEALDAAGQVYVFGKGANQRFDSEPREPDFVEFMDYGVVRDLWQQRICPSPDSTTTSTGVTVKNSATGSKGEPTQSKRNHSAVGKRPSPYRMKFEASARAFTNRQVSKATAFLWGKRVNQVACGPAIAYALTDAGEIFCWGGNKRQWRYFYDESTSGSGLASNSGEDSSISANQPEPPVIRHLLTARSEMLKLFALPSQVVENQEKHNQLGLRQKYAKVFGNRVTSTLTDEAKAKRLQTVGQYYGLLKPSTPRQLSLPSLEDLMETVEPDLDVDDLSLSLYIRGVEVAKPIRMILIETVGECLELEIECVGTKFHEHFKQQDQIARRYRRERRERALAFLSFKTTALWFDLAQLREKMINAENERIMKGDEEYDDMKRKITRSTQKLKRQAREGYIDTVGADDNNSPNNNGSHDGEKRAEEALLNIGGLTTRGPSFQFFDGSHALQSIAVGSRHALAIHSSGKLYTWGVGSFGRLGVLRFPLRERCTCGVQRHTANLALVLFQPKKASP
ncbi:hypothetical protein PHYBOEH_000483 [Phytophthora boehmeriae]|uniref:EF-hand domain-containing protein n=1 Tax=Phytophthora boehmeriae TaxID=109152 RepID=A0A8T1WUU2_9STRA|nr:hypothetical protein PHYBOEH_000483 [Phytophthora boehmeriae]